MEVIAYDNQELQRRMNRVNTKSEFSANPFIEMGKLSKQVYRTGEPFVGIEQYLEDDYYMGKIAKDLYPDNKPDLIDIFKEGNQYVEVVFTGGTSIGKTFMACIGVTYMIARLGNYLRPHEWVGGSPASPIVGINMSITATKAKAVVFNRVKNMVDSSPYFKELFKRDMRLSDKLVWRISQDESSRIQRTGGSIEFVPGTGDSLSALGDDIYFGVGDELNFFRIVEKSKKAREERYDPAQTLYDTISRRMLGRFSAGGLPLGKFFLLSSSMYPEDFTERRIEEARADGSLGKTVKVIRKATWEAKKGVCIRGVPVYGDKIFRVEVGSSRRGSRLLDTYNMQTKEVKVGEHADIEGKILEVPVELWDKFHRDVDGAVRDFGGETTRAVSPFFPDQSILYEAEVEELKHPYSKFETTLRDGATLLRDILFAKDENGRMRPRRHPRVPRFFHGDVSFKNDEYGLAITHVAGWTQVMGTEKVIVDRPIIELDLLLRLVSPRGGQFQLDDVVTLFLKLRNMGMYFGYGTFDLRLLSTHTIQRMESKQFNVGYLSVDKDLGPYQNMKDAFFDGCIRIYKFENNLLIDEIGGLERKRDKVDHRPDSDKGLSDALAGAVYNTTTNAYNFSPASQESKLPYMAQNIKKDKEKSRKEELNDFNKWVREGN